jgi:hypothetical protein
MSKLDTLPTDRWLTHRLFASSVLFALAVLTGCGSDVGAEAGERRDADVGGVGDDARIVDQDASEPTPGDASEAPSDADSSETGAASDAAAPKPLDAGRDASTPVGDSALPHQADAGGAVRACKRGVAYNREQAGDAKLFGGALSWWYDWGANPDAAALAALEAAGAEFVPMIWSGPPRRDIDVQALIRGIPRSAKYLLGFNEPNFGSQANLTPEQAAAAWPKLEEIARARNLKLVSPAPNYCGGNCNQTDPFAWLDAFFAACTGCQVDYVAFHWYACSIEALKTMLGRYAKYKKPLWITEFACLDDPGDHSAAGQRAYMDKAVALLESDPQVFRYAWFIGRSSQPGAIDLFGAPGALTPLGSAYSAYPGSCP